ncbi:MAG TPA: zeta toxin family protein [Gemmataceae bacterium]|nr:zeta toxin family protein [Gemmataceae bacterium]
MPTPSPRAIVLAGPNGAGKTTAARTLLAETLSVMAFVNADAIAQGLSGFDTDSAAVEASRIMLERLHKLADQRADFAFETTLAARSYAGWLARLRETGYVVHLYYFWLATPDLAVARVAQRVSSGGHDIPEVTICQRYWRSLRNFFTLYRPVADVWQVYDNTQVSQSQLVASGDNTGKETVLNQAAWERMQKEQAQ